MSAGDRRRRGGARCERGRRRGARRSGPRSRPCGTDVSDAAAVEALAARAVERFGAVHVVCNNAGVVTLGPTWEQSARRLAVGARRRPVGRRPRRAARSCRSCCARASPATSSTRRRSPGSCRHRRSRPTTSPRPASSRSPRRSTWSCARPGRRSACRCCAPGVVPTRIAESGRNRPGGGGRTPLDIPTQARAAADGADRRRRSPTAWSTPIVDDRFWIVTHEGSFDLVAERAAGITDGGRPSAPPVF